jgi:hypothetical protein
MPKEIKLYHNYNKFCGKGVAGIIFALEAPK